MSTARQQPLRALQLQPGAGADAAAAARTLLAAGGRGAVEPFISLLPALLVCFGQRVLL
jgi:hypothetical protein